MISCSYRISSCTLTSNAVPQPLSLTVPQTEDKAGLLFFHQSQQLSGAPILDPTWSMNMLLHVELSSKKVFSWIVLFNYIELCFNPEEKDKNVVTLEGQDHYNAFPWLINQSPNIHASSLQIAHATNTLVRFSSSPALDFSLLITASQKLASLKAYLFSFPLSHRSISSPSLSCVRSKLTPSSSRHYWMLIQKPFSFSSMLAELYLFLYPLSLYDGANPGVLKLLVSGSFGTLKNG